MYYLLLLACRTASEVLCVYAMGYGELYARVACETAGDVL